MSELFKNFLDLNKLSYGQIKTALIISVSCIGAMYFVGQKTSEFKHTIDQTYEMTLQNSEAIEKMNAKMADMELKSKQNYNEFYNNMLMLNEQNMKVWDSKFSLLIKYGDKNKSLLLELLEMENEKQKSANEAFLLKQNYTTTPYKTDTSKFSIIVKKKDL